MPADQVADRAVGAHPQLLGAQRLGEVVAEAAQHLELEVRVAAAGKAVVGDRVSDRAQVVRADLHPHERPRVEQRGA